MFCKNELITSIFTDKLSHKKLGYKQLPVIVVININWNPFLWILPALTASCQYVIYEIIYLQYRNISS